jgi:CRISPR-associated protein Csb2
MLAIKMRFLAGRFHATPWGHHVNEGVVEYPPSLYRLLRSLVATARRACLGQVSEEQLQRIVMALAAPPEFHLPNAAVAHTRHYDQANGGVKFFDTFVSLQPQDDLYWLWHDAELAAEDRAALRQLLTALGTFGRAESWCEAELLEPVDAAAITINSQPLTAQQGLSQQETLRLLLPQASLSAAELMKVLETETSVMRKGKQLEPSGTRWLTYTRPANILTPRRTMKPALNRNVRIVTVARYELDATVLPPMQEAMRFAEQVRRALIRNRVETSHSEAIVGKTSEGVPLDGHLHAHYLATDEDHDGRLDHVTVYAPRGFDAADQQALGAIRTIYRRDELPNVKLVLTGLGTVAQMPKLALFQQHKRWRSVTPFSLPRFANRGGGKPPRPRDLPEAQLVRELQSRGFPEPISIQRVEGYAPNNRPLVRWLEFHTRRFNGTEGFGLAGFEIEFAEAQVGPIALGFGCHFGLGLFLPVA